jgi:hypothetical protein
METFVFLWQLLESHGVVPNKKAACAQLWATFNIEQQREIYRSIRDKLRAGKFVHYDPVKAVRENAPRAKKQQILSYKEYYLRYGTTEEREGWKMANPTGEKVIYVKAVSQTAQ